jgi:hypothetical protein
MEWRRKLRSCRPLNVVVTLRDCCIRNLCLHFPLTQNLVPHGQPRARDGADAERHDLRRLVSANATARRSCVVRAMCMRRITKPDQY